MGIPLLSDLVIIFGLSMVVLFLCHRLRIPTIVGFLVTGVLSGPHGFGIILAVHEIELLAEVGVVLLLFTIGIEFSLQSLLRIKRAVLLGGTLQVALTIAAVMGLTTLGGYELAESTFIGCLISLSSTAIVLKILQERAEIDSPHGRTSLAILIFQDLIVVPMMLITPLLAGSSQDSGPSILWPMALGLCIIAVVLLSARWIVPQVLYQVARTRNRELFLLSVVVMCFAVAWLTSSVGLSLALGAFLAGLIISESEYSHQALGHVFPFRDVFTSLFFVSIGMLLNVEVLFQQPWQIVSISTAILLLKFLVAASVTVILGFPLRTAILAGLTLCQVGEFAFVLAKAGQPHGLLGGQTYQLFLASSILTMAAAPFMIALAPRVAEGVLRLRWPQQLKNGLYPMPAIQAPVHDALSDDHLLIIGFGVNGRNVARAARVAGIPYTVIEINPDTVRQERLHGEPIFYGDACQEAVLEQAGIHTARTLVVAISDPAATRNIVAHTRYVRPALYIIARTRYLNEVASLYDLGANEVIPEEFETSVEIFTRVLMKYLVPQDEIERFVADVRADGYRMFRSMARVPTTITDLQTALADVDIRSFRVAADSSLVDKTILEIGLRRQYGVTILAIRRDNRTMTNPGGDTRLRADDILVILGTPDQFPELIPLFMDAYPIPG